MAHTSTEYLECIVHPRDRQQIRQLPFDTGYDVERLEISYQVTEGNVVDLGLILGEEMIGWSGGARRQIFISENVATPGYPRTAIPHGRGYVLLGLHKINNVCRIRIEIVRQHKSPRWLRGDTHLHSEHSDGKLSVDALIARASAQNHDFLCFTDHNTTTQNRVIDGINSPLCLIPGMELTTALGHVNFIGVPEPVARFLPSATAAEIMEKIAEAHSNGARIGINHPFCQHCPWRLPFAGHDWLEVWNGPWKATTNNETAFQYWLQQLKAGHDIPITAGSDFHKEKQQTLPFVMAHSRSRERRDILHALTHGQSYLQSHPDIQLHQFALGDAEIGDTSTESQLHIDLELPVHQQALLYTEHGVHELNNRHGRVQQEVDCRHSRFAFLRVNEAGAAQLITNPIFRE